MKLGFSSVTLRQAMSMIPAEEFTVWDIVAPPKQPSPTLLDFLKRLESFELMSSEAAKILLIDTLFAEVVPHYPHLKIWKTALLESELLTGFADYLIAPRRAFVATPLLCVAEAKKDDFEQGRIQCVAEMVACRENNLQEKYPVDVYDIVSNGQSWRFYRLDQVNAIYESGYFFMEALPELLGVLDSVCAACAQSVPA